VDAWLPELLARLEEGDLLILTADHGNDPTTPSTDHSREYVPLLVYGPRLRKGVPLGVRRSLADVGQTVADVFLGRGSKSPAPAPILEKGTSFLDEIL
jgi:phosphopentomutase